ncbi:hypothetical protein [Dactylosporangium sp. NPDC000521]|uniref:hypothetical protein n=1 Tax=Dactylosporangium sp. NPDC000521 TaxID=3363975 RepID=UPI0036A18160
MDNTTKLWNVTDPARPALADLLSDQSDDVYVPPDPVDLDGRLIDEPPVAR